MDTSNKTARSDTAIMKSVVGQPPSAGRVVCIRNARTPNVDCPITTTRTKYGRGSDATVRCKVVGENVPPPRRPSGETVSFSFLWQRIRLIFFFSPFYRSQTCTARVDFLRKIKIFDKSLFECNGVVSVENALLLKIYGRN